MNNNENNNLDMNKPKTEKEYYVTKLEKYKESNKEENVCIMLYSITASIGGMAIVVGSSIDVFNIWGVISGLGIVSGTYGLTMLAIAIAKKAGLESSINAIKEKLELLDLQNNQNINENSINSGEEKGRNR